MNFLIVFGLLLYPVGLVIATLSWAHRNSPKPVRDMMFCAIIVLIIVPAVIATFLLP